MPCTLHFATVCSCYVAHNACEHLHSLPFRLPSRPAAASRPLVLRAFNSKPDAAAFIRAAGFSATSSAASQPPHQPHQQHQQRRDASSWAGPRQHSPHQAQDEYGAIYTPPPPPFAVEHASFFPAIVRQQVRRACGVVLVGVWGYVLGC